MKTIRDQFLAFARSKPPGEHYEYCDRTVCACAQFAATIGLAERYEHFAMTPLSKPEEPSVDMNLFMPLEVFAMATPHTWGGIVERMTAKS